MRTVVIASGYFDPIHVGHIDYFRLAKKHGDVLVVIVNNDEQAIMKKGYSFMPEQARIEIVKSIRYVDGVILSVDTDQSVCNTLKLLSWQLSKDALVFAKGGDRFSSEIPEGKICSECGIKIIDGLGEKIQSSSELVSKATQRKQ